MLAGFPTTTTLTFFDATSLSNRLYSYRGQEYLTQGAGGRNVSLLTGHYSMKVAPKKDDDMIKYVKYSLRIKYSLPLGLEDVDILGQQVFPLHARATREGTCVREGGREGGGGTGEKER